MISPFSVDTHASILAQIAVATAAGVVGGAVHYYCLWRSVRLLATGGSAVRALAFQLVRLVLVAAALWLVAAHGAVPLLAATLGLLSARTVAIRALGAVR